MFGVLYWMMQEQSKNKNSNDQNELQPSLWRS